MSVRLVVDNSNNTFGLFVYAATFGIPAMVIRTGLELARDAAIERRLAGGDEAETRSVMRDYILRIVANCEIYGANIDEMKRLADLDIDRLLDLARSLQPLRAVPQKPADDRKPAPAPADDNIIDVEFEEVFDLGRNGDDTAILVAIAA